MVHATIFGSSTAAGIVIPTELMMGTVARVNPNAIFYPAVLNQNLSTPQKTEAWNRLARTAAFRAVGFSEGILGERVTFGKNATKVVDGRPELSFDYAYNLTGYDFGLQRAPGLRQEVSGHCQTEYSWTQESSNATHDIYWLWGEKQNERIVPIASNVTYPPPRANFEVSGSINADMSITGQGTARYSILPFTAGRRSRVSFNKTIHPWYATEDFYDPVTVTQYAVMSKRPAIACYQNTTWHYGTLKIQTAYAYPELVAAGLKVAQFWLDTVFIREFTSAPPIVTMSRNLGWANLPNFSEGFQRWNRLENSAANLVDDLKYLVMGSFVYSREIVRNTALLSPNREGLVNAAEVNGVVPDEVADFVLASSDIQTMSLRVLVSIPGIFLALWGLALCEKRILACFSTARNNGRGGAALITRSVGFSAVQLYRYLDEELNGWRRWEGRLSAAPYIKKVMIEENSKADEDAKTVRIPVSAQYPANYKLRAIEIPISEGSTVKVAKYAIPTLMPVYQCIGTSNSEKNAEASGQRFTIINEKEVPPTPSTECSSSYPSTISTLDEKGRDVSRPSKRSGQYKLAMATTRDPKLVDNKEGKKIWKTVQGGVHGRIIRRSPCEQDANSGQVSRQSNITNTRLVGSASVC